MILGALIAGSFAADGHGREPRHRAWRGASVRGDRDYSDAAVLRSRSWKPATGKEELLGEEGEVIEPVDPDAAHGNGTGPRRTVAGGDAGGRKHSAKARACTCEA